MSNLERWKEAIEDVRWKFDGKDLRFEIPGTYDKDGLRPKISIMERNVRGYEEPYATLTHNEPDIELAEDEIMVRYDGHHVYAAEAMQASELFEEQLRDDTTIGLGGVWKLKGGLP